MILLFLVLWRIFSLHISTISWQYAEENKIPVCNFFIIIRDILQGGPKVSLPKKIWISAFCFNQVGCFFFVDDRGVFKVFIHKKNIKKYFFELQLLIWIQKFNLLRYFMDGILKTCLCRQACHLWMTVYPCPIWHNLSILFNCWKVDVCHKSYRLRDMTSL
jgi:hypothetical protein